MSVLKILTWNICWEAMKAKNFGEKCAPDICKKNVLKKIVDINREKGLDFILLQEAEIEENELELGDGYNKISFKNGKLGNAETSIIFYNETIWRVLTKTIITWAFHAGRPFIIALFQNNTTKQNILITNLHGPQSALIDKKTGNSLSNYLDFLDYYRLGGPSVDYTGSDLKKNTRIDLTNLPIIIGGDFNLENPVKNKIFNQTFYIEGNQKTCCDQKFRAQGLSLSYDHILINDKLTYKKVEYPKVDDKMYSDHIPVYAEINMPNIIVVTPKKYGFGFDGVIHKSVSIPFSDGSRHLEETDKGLIKSDKIFKKIEKYLNDGHIIEIISSRYDQSKFKPYLIENSDICRLKEDKIIINEKAKGVLKHEIVANSGVIEFYDDSINELQNIILELRKIKVTTMKLFFVRPDLDDFIEVVSIAQLKSELIKLNIRLLCDKSIKNIIDTDHKNLKQNINLLLLDSNNLYYVMLHQEKRFLELDYILTQNKKAKIIIAADLDKKNSKVDTEVGHKHSLGTGLARDYWGEDKIDCEIMLENIDNWVQKLIDKFGDRINFGKIGKDIEGANSISKDMIHVWGANYTNWNLDINEEISGAGQASVIGKQKIGVFGIITVTVPDSDREQILSKSKTNHLE